MQDAAVLEVFKLVERIDAAHDRHLRQLAVGRIWPLAARGLFLRNSEQDRNRVNEYYIQPVQIGPAQCYVEKMTR